MPSFAEAVIISVAPAWLHMLYRLTAESETLTKTEVVGLVAVDRHSSPRSLLLETVSLQSPGVRQALQGSGLYRDKFALPPEDWGLGWLGLESQDDRNRFVVAEDVGVDAHLQTVAHDLRVSCDGIATRSLVNYSVRAADGVPWKFRVVDGARGVSLGSDLSQGYTGLTVARFAGGHFELVDGPKAQMRALWSQEKPSLDFFRIKVTPEGNDLSIGLELQYFLRDLR